MDSNTVAAQIARLRGWGRIGPQSGVRAGFRCEYCDRDLLSSVDDYKAWAMDHLVPDVAGGTYTFENIVVACHPCNSLYKNKWDPLSVTGDGATREEMLAATRSLIGEKRRAGQLVLEQVREMVGWTPRDGTTR